MSVPNVMDSARKNAHTEWLPTLGDLSKGTQYKLNVP